MICRTFRPVSPYLMLVVGALVLGLSGCAPSSLSTTITHSPIWPAEGGQVVFTINYRNNTEQDRFSGVNLEVTFAPELVFLHAAPAQVFVDSNTRRLSWNLGDLESGQSGSVQVTFEVAKGFPREIYHLDVTAKIQGKDAQGEAVSYQNTGSTEIEGHPTLTPVPTIPPTQGPSKVEGTQPPAPVVPTPQVMELSDEFGNMVTVELPWQGQDLHIERMTFPNSVLDDPIEGDHHLIRKIIYFEVMDKGGKEVSAFSPPMTITVPYTTEDLSQVDGNPNLLFLAIYNHEKRTWFVREDTRINPENRNATLTVKSWYSHMSWSR